MATTEKKTTTRKAAPAKAPQKKGSDDTQEAKVEAALPKGSMKPEALAAQIGVSGKNLRAWLRRNHPRPEESKNTAWIIPAEVVKEAREAFKKQEASA